MTLSIIIASAGFALVALFEFFSKNTSDNKRSKIYSYLVVICALISQIIGGYISVKQDKDNNNLMDSLTQLNIANSNMRHDLSVISYKLDSCNITTSYILSAINSKGYYYDSSNRELKPIHVNSQFNMPDVKIMGGKNQFGNGNTQNN